MLGYFKRVEDASGTKRGEAGPSSASNNASNASNASSNSNNKRPRVTTTEEGEAALKGGKSPPNPVTRGDPLTIVTWNANGLGVRLGKDWQDLQDFLTTNTPDVCCIQEVRYAAAGLPKCKKDDNRGRKRGQLKEDTTADRKDRDLLQNTLSSLARRLGYRVVMSLANYKYAGTAALIRKTCPAANIFYSVGPDGLSKEHHLEGRVIALEYASFTLLVLYVPNNGVTPDSFRRREAWDSNMRAFVNGYHRPVIISGDLNVAHEDADLTHPSYFKRMCPASDPQNSGQPGCTPAEKERHSLLRECGGGLIDAYRLLHPAPSPESASSSEGQGTNTPGITWRGTAGNEVAAAGRFYGKGMRIDYFLLSKALEQRVSAIKVFGKGADREGFLGSDHSPVMLALRERNEHEEEELLKKKGESESEGGGNAENGVTEEDGAGKSASP